MDMSGKQQVPVNQQKVWEALNDPDVLKACIPGCEEMEQTGDNEFKAQVRAAVGPVKSKFKGTMRTSNVKPPESYTLSFQGDGGAGFVKGKSDVRLEKQDSGEGTSIIYDASATIGGKLAQIGSRVVDGASRKMANEFFSNLTKHLGGSYEETESQKKNPKQSKSKQTAGAASGGAKGQPEHNKGAASSGERGGATKEGSGAKSAAASSAGAGSARREESESRKTASSSAADSGGGRALGIGVTAGIVIIIIAILVWLLAT